MAAEHLTADLGCRVAVTVREDVEQQRSLERSHELDDADLVVHGGRFITAARLPGRTGGLAEDDRSFVMAVLQVVTGTADRAAAVADLRRSALYDALTGLPNRMLLTDRLELAVERVTRSGGFVAVLFCDLDDFKEVNDRLGHAVGDTLLVEVARALSAAARGSDTISRFGGDEFVVVADGLVSRRDALGVGSRLEAAARGVTNPITGTGVRMSVGVAVTGQEAASPTYLLRAADMAMYRAKADGGGVRIASEPARPDRQPTGSTESTGSTETSESTVS
jgi:diguanylate cyclase (GGDEF)-like protein